MKYALLLNDMRWPNVENIAIVTISDNRQELVDWYTAQLAEKPYQDGQWGKAFKPGSDLEWYNPVHDLNVDNDYWGGIWQVPDDAAVGMASQRDTGDGSTNTNPHPSSPERRTQPPVSEDQGQVDLLQVHRPADREGGLVMAVLELYGKCKELGYCDCKGFFGCVDPRPPAPKPVIENELRNAMQAEREVSDYKNHNLKNELALVECQVCDRSHAPGHPHIANIDGDTPIDDEPGEDRPGPVEPVVPRGRTIPARAGLPDWLKDKPEAKCDVCGKIKRSNHNCKGQPKAYVARIAGMCEDCKSAGELCVLHGGVWSSYDTAKGQVDERVAESLPAPVSVMQSEKTHMCRNGHPRTPENIYIRSDGRSECKECKRVYKKNWTPVLPAEADRELAAIGAILRAVEGLGSNQLKRVMSYVAARLEETE